jgi:hypothetical protein
MKTIELKGWTHVHTWHESHGECFDDIYQRDIKPDDWWGRRVELLHVSTYRDGRPTGMRVESDKHAHDYLLAREIRANVEGRYRAMGERHIAPCCTAGSEEFTDTATGNVFRIFGAAGHGEWAFDVTDDDLKDALHDIADGGFNADAMRRIAKQALQKAKKD